MADDLRKWVQKHRVRLGLTQKGMAEELGVSRSLVARWEARGEVTKRRKKELDKFFDPLPESAVAKSLQSADALFVESETSSFGSWLARERQKKNLSVIQLARKAGLSIPTVYNIENGKIQNPQVSTRESLVNAIGVVVPSHVIKETEEDQSVEGVGHLTDFDPYSPAEWPAEAGVYVLYDIS